MFLDIIYIIGGLLLILFGANWLTDGASSLSLKMAIPPIVVGLTVVAFGTSTPELAVSLTSAMKGSADMAVGNVVGSNIFNTLLIVGCTAVVAPIVVSSNTLKKEIPFTVLASFALMFLAFDILLTDAPKNVLTRSDGLILLLFFAIFVAYVLAISRDPSNKLEESNTPTSTMSIPKSIFYILLGLVGLIFGGNVFVTGASNVARLFNVSESVIGLTLVAGGTSLPELATSVVAALKKNPGIAIGNVVGSSLFNIFFVLGASATITPLNIQGVSEFDILMLVFSSILLFIVALCYGKRTINRVEGAVFILLYIAYIIYLIQGA